MSELTNEQIVAGAAVLDDDGRPVGRNTAIMVADAMFPMQSLAPIPEQVAQAAEPPHLSTDESREYLVKFMEQHFTDKTFHRYIRGTRGSVNLAGDFAWQMARALRIIQASVEQTTGAQEVTKQAAKAERNERFYMDHGVWHDLITGQHMWTQDQYDEAMRDARATIPAISTAASQSSIIGAWNDALEEAALICDRVNNHDDPMTAIDCADCIRELKSDLAPTTSTVRASGADGSAA